ncbi:MAG: exosortase [Pseudomonadota bacterium]
MALTPPLSRPAWSVPHVPGPWVLVALSVVAMYAQSVWDLMHGIWSTSEQAHGPLVLALSAALFWLRRDNIIGAPVAPAPRVAWPLLAFALLLFVFGRSQGILIFEMGSLLPLLAAVLLFRGPAALKASAFALFFLFFMIPLPGPVVDAVTQPMKLSVSYVTEHVLFALGYPISRNGVLLQIAQYQLQVADACAGLHTLFTLEAMGLLYLNVVRHASAVRNITLAILIVPISFAANVIRVIVLTLITYHWGDEAGQGFLHGFAGLVLFLAALVLIMGADSLLRFGVKKAITS